MHHGDARAPSQMPEGAALPRRRRQAWPSASASMLPALVARLDQTAAP